MRVITAGTLTQIKAVAAHRTGSHCTIHSRHSQLREKPDSLKNALYEAVNVLILLNLDPWVHAFLIL